jgi:NhaP-type Na+/H+ and K+/H+ antiporter
MNGFAFNKNDVILTTWAGLFSIMNVLVTLASIDEAKLFFQFGIHIVNAMLPINDINTERHSIQDTDDPLLFQT